MTDRQSIYRKCVWCSGRTISDPVENVFLCAEHLFEFDHGVTPEEQIPQNPTWRFHDLSESSVG